MRRGVVCGSRPGDQSWRSLGMVDELESAVPGEEGGNWQEPADVEDGVSVWRRHEIYLFKARGA